MSTEVKLPKAKNAPDTVAVHEAQLKANHQQVDRRRRQADENGTPSATPTTPKRLVP